MAYKYVLWCILCDLNNTEQAYLNFQITRQKYTSVVTAVNSYVCKYVS